MARIHPSIFIANDGCRYFSKALDVIFMELGLGLFTHSQSIMGS